MEKVQEYHLTIKPTSLVRGRGLCKLIAENKESLPDSTEVTPSVLLVSETDPWFSNVTYFLTYGECPPNMSYKEKHNLRLKAKKYVISNGVLYKRGMDGTFLRCADKEQHKMLLKLYHSDVFGGYFSSAFTAFKILRNYFYSPGMFKDAFFFCIKL